jgi:ABC-type lipoprotein export system ATPase subunit
MHARECQEALLADEPMGCLDRSTAREIAALVRRMAHERSIGIPLATHDAIMAEAVDRLLIIADGSVGAVQVRADGDLWLRRDVTALEGDEPSDAQKQPGGNRNE